MRNVASLPPHERAVRALEQVLPRGVLVERNGNNGSVRIRGTPLTLRWVGEGWPSDLRKHIVEDLEGELLAARYFSEGARRILEKHGVGWVDETGGAEFSVGPIVVSRSGDPKAAKRLRPRRWTPAVTSVSEAILCGASPTVKSMVEATGLSNGASGKALRFLTDQGLLEQDVARGPRSGRRLRDPGRLLDAYAEAVAESEPGPRLELGVLWDDAINGVTQVGKRLASEEISWACTSAVGAQLLAPYLTTVATAEVYVDGRTLEELRAIAELLELRPVEGGRLILQPFPAMVTKAFSTTHDGLAIAPWPRVFADLLGYGVRGPDAAEHLREVFLEA